MFNELDFKEIDLTKEAPLEETKRQYYYIAKVRGLIAQKKTEAGKDFTYCLQTFGCQMNEKQSEVVSGIMDEMGYVRKDTEDADVVIYNLSLIHI